MSHGQARGRAFYMRCPRVSGDEPIFLHYWVRLRSFSPRERG